MNGLSNIRQQIFVSSSPHNSPYALLSMTPTLFLYIRRKSRNATYTSDVAMSLIQTFATKLETVKGQ